MVIEFPSITFTIVKATPNAIAAMTAIDSRRYSHGAPKANTRCTEALRLVKWRDPQPHTTKLTANAFRADFLLGLGTAWSGASAPDSLNKPSAAGIAATFPAMINFDCIKPDYEFS
jgi:hypothetical protein